MFNKLLTIYSCILIMFPTIDKNMKQQRQPSASSLGYEKIVADNTSKMIEILQSVIKSNEHANSKTDKLAMVSEQMVTISQNMVKVSEQMMSFNEENIKWLKRLDKRMYYMNQNFTGNFLMQDNVINKSPEKQRDNISSKNKEEEDNQRAETKHGGFNDVRLKSFDEPHEMALMRRESDLSKTSRIMVPFTSLYSEEVKNGTVQFNDIKIQLATWVGELYREVTSNTYSRYINSVYSEEEARLVYCQTIILNNLQMMSWFREHNKSLWNKKRYEVINHVSNCSKKILGFLKVKVPRNKKNFKSLQFENMVERVNNSEDPRYDILKNSQLLFEVAEDKDVHYVRQIKIMFNTLITQVEKEYPNFNRNMVQIFTNGEENCKVKYLIGKKFKDNIPRFSEQELNTLSFKCKSPQILRILIKWLQEMEEMIKNPEQYINKKKVFKSYKKDAKDPVPVSEKIKKQIIKQIQDSSEKLKSKFDNVKDILSDLINNISELVYIKPEASQFLDHEDIKAIKFSQLISESLPFLAVTRIEMIVEVCRSFQKDHKSSLLEFVDLLTFSVFDLLRCKCIGSKVEIQNIYKRLVDSKYLELIRVKNRLDTPLNDIMINCRVKGSPLICQVQLLITNELITDKSDKNQHFNHFLYQLQRSKFGPLCQACIIINDSDPRMQYIDQLKKIKMRMPALTTQQQNSLVLTGATKKCYNNHKLNTMHFSIPFVCSMCSIFSKQYSSSFDSYYCQDCNFAICPSCFLDKISETQKKQKYLFKNQSFRKVFYKDTIYQMKNYKGKKLKSIMTDILSKNNSKYCMIISYAQGVISKKGYKLIGDTIFPTYFTLTKKPAVLDDYDKYDVLILFDEKSIQDISPKELIKRGDVLTTNSLVTREIIEDFTAKEKINLKCISDDNVILVIDFDESDVNIEGVMKEHKLRKTINQCKNSKITTLNISSEEYTDVSKIRDYASSLQHVLTVVADQNNLTSLDVFWSLKNLKKLSLKQNKIGDIEKIDLSALPNFVDLFLAVNKFVQFPVILAPEMTRVSFKRNEITNIQKLTESEMPKLLELGLAQNKISKLVVMNLPSVKKIVLSKNKIQDISVLNSSQIPKVETLDLDGNKITAIPELNFPDLKTLNLAKNSITSIDTLQTSNLKGLQDLFLFKNSISLIPALKFDKLKVLDLSANKIQKLVNITSKEFPKLLELNLSKNSLKEVPAFNFQSLSKLNLSENQISKLVAEVDGKPSYFFDSNLPSISSLSLALANKFVVKQLILIELNRWFTNAKYLD